jgi:hypothetical protein
MIGLSRRLEGGLVVIDLVQQEMVRIATKVEDVEALAAGLLSRSGAVLAARKLSRSAGTISRSTALTNIPADCASTRWPTGSMTKQVAEIASVAAAIEIDLSM